MQAKEAGILSRSSQEQPTRDRGSRYDAVWERDWGEREEGGTCACCNADISYGKENMFLSHVHRNDESTKARSRQTYEMLSKGRYADDFSLGHVEADAYTRTGPARSALVSEFKFQEPNIVTECSESSLSHMLHFHIYFHTTSNQQPTDLLIICSSCCRYVQWHPHARQPRGVQEDRRHCSHGAPA